jgi:site-specific DNA recombinase
MKARQQKLDSASRRTVGYVRCSTEEQATLGVSLDVQKARICAYAEAMALQIDEVVIDAGYSAKSLQRPRMLRVADGVRRGLIGIVIVLKLDRLTRSTRDLADVLDLGQKNNAALISVCESLDTKSASGRMVVNMLGVVSQWEREAIGERTAIALEHKRHQRQAYAPTPFGYRREGNHLVENAKDMISLHAAQRMDRNGFSYREIARMFTDQGVRPHRGSIWHASSVRAVLRSRIAQEAATYAHG